MIINTYKNHTFHKYIDKLCVKLLPFFHNELIGMFLSNRMRYKPFNNLKNLVKDYIVISSYKKAVLRVKLFKVSSSFSRYCFSVEKYAYPLNERLTS